MMPRPRFGLRPVLLVGVSALALFGVGGGRASAQIGDAPTLVVQTVSLGGTSLTAILLGADEPVASTEYVFLRGTASHCKSLAPRSGLSVLRSRTRSPCPTASRPRAQH